MTFSVTLTIPSRKRVFTFSPQMNGTMSPLSKAKGLLRLTLQILLLLNVGFPIGGAVAFEHRENVTVEAFLIIALLLPLLTASLIRQCLDGTATFPVCLIHIQALSLWGKARLRWFSSPPTQGVILNVVKNLGKQARLTFQILFIPRHSAPLLATARSSLSKNLFCLWQNYFLIIPTHCNKVKSH
jgi:hypothetical protein